MATPPAASTTKSSATPAGLTATPAGGGVTLSWNLDPDAVAYNVYRSPLSGGGYAKIASRVGGASYTDTIAANGNQYYYVVRGVDAAGNEGEQSSEAAVQG